MSDEIQAMFDRLSKSERTQVAEALERINVKLEARAKMADSLMTLLRPYILKLIKQEIANANLENGNE